MPAMAACRRATARHAATNPDAIRVSGSQLRDTRVWGVSAPQVDRVWGTCGSYSAFGLCNGPST